MDNLKAPIAQSFGVVFAVLAAWLWVGLTLADVGAYRAVVLLPVACGLSVLAAAMAWRHGGQAGDPVSWRTSAWLAVWMALATATVARPGEYLLDGGDASVYLNLGRAVERHGGLWFAEPLLDTIDRADWPALFDRDRGRIEIYDLFPGGVQVRPDRNVVQPSFFHLLPVAIADAAVVFGERSASYVTPIFAVLSVVAIWLLARVVSSLTAANIAAGLLAINFAQIWFGRMPTSEMLAQYLLLTGLYFAVVSARTPTVTSGAAAGAAFGLAACTRIEVLFLVVPIVAVYLVLTRSGRRTSPAWMPMAGVFVALVLQAVGHAYWRAEPYTARILQFAFLSRSVRYLSLLLPVVVLVFGAAAWWLGTRSVRDPSRGLRAAAVVTVVLLAAVRLGPTFVTGYLPMLLTPLGLALALVGAWRLVAEDESPVSLLLVGVFLASALVFVESPRDGRLMPSIFRRFVPVVVPLALLLAGHALSFLRSRAGRWTLLVWLIPLVLGLAFLDRSRVMLMAAPMAGVYDQLATVDRLVPSGAVVVTDAASPSHFGLSLRYTFGRDVIATRPGRRVAGVLADLAATLARASRPLVVAVARDTPGAQALGPDDFSALSLTPFGSVTLTRAELTPTTTRFPTEWRSLRSTVDLYTAGSRRPAVLPLALEIGEYDVAWRGEGFYDAEPMAGVVARWTTGIAVVAVPEIAHTTSPIVVVARLSAVRPPGIDPPSVRFEIDGRLVGVTPPIRGVFQEVVLPVDREVAARLMGGPSRLLVRAPTFVPGLSGASGDSRRLGVAIDWIRIEPR